METAILARGLIKRYGALTAVDGIDLDVPRRMCFGILGPNGAGKTSTIRMIACRFPPDEGALTVLGMDVRTRAREIKAKIGLVPQENNLDEDLSLLENLELYGMFFGLKRRELRPRALELLDFMELGSKADAVVKTLSGGMKRRAVVARALINRPELIILDEPTTGLDPQARVLLWERLRALKAQGVTLLLTTHYMDEAQRLCDELVIMHEGRIIDRDAPQALVDRHVGRWAAEARINGAPDLDAIMARLSQAVRRYELTGEILHVYADDDRVLLDVLDKVEHASYQIRPANLEDVFLVRTGREIRE